MTHSSIIDELFRCVEVVGTKKTLQVLRETQDKNIKLDDKRAQFVVELVAENFNISPREIIYGSGRMNNRKLAFGFCVRYLWGKEFFNMDIEEVSDLMKKIDKRCWQMAKMVNNLDPKHPYEQQFVAMRDRLDKVVSEKINNEKQTISNEN